MNNKVEGLILQSDNPLSYEESGTSTDIPPYEGTDSDSLGGYHATDFAKLSDIDGMVMASIDVTYNGGGN